MPLSGAIFSLAAAGIIADMNPTLRNLLMTLRLFNPEGGIGTHGYIVAGGGALLASLLNIMRFLSKPGLGYASGTAGTLSAPVYASAENLASVVFLALIILLARINPWLLVALVAIVALFILHNHALENGARHRQIPEVNQDRSKGGPCNRPGGYYMGIRLANPGKLAAWNV